MAEALRDLLLGSQALHSEEQGRTKDTAAHETYSDPNTLSYLTYLSEQPLESFQSQESQHLSATSHSLLLSIQALSNKSHAAVVHSASSHASLSETLPILSRRAGELTSAVPKLDIQAEQFSTAFKNTSDSSVLAQRKKTLRLLLNSDRLVDVMELPPLLSSSLSANPVNYPTTLDLYAHVRRLASLYPNSSLTSTVLSEAEVLIQQMVAGLIAALQAPTLKLAGAVKTVGWLRRLVPDMVSEASPEDVLPVLFLVCRLTTLVSTLEALEPLRELADKERLRQKERSGQTWSGGQQTERYLKRFIEVFREHSFNIISVHKSVNASFNSQSPESLEDDPLKPLPSALSTLPLHLVDMLIENLRIHLPTVKDQVSRESILTQVLYFASSMGRLGADFGTLLSSLGVGELVDLAKRHRQLAGRLESVIGDYRG